MCVCVSLTANRLKNLEVLLATKNNYQWDGNLDWNKFSLCGRHTGVVGLSKTVTCQSVKHETVIGFL